MKFAKKIIYLTLPFIVAVGVVACATVTSDYETCDTPNCGDNVIINVMGD